MYKVAHHATSHVTILHGQNRFVNNFRLLIIIFVLQRKLVVIRVSTEVSATVASVLAPVDLRALLARSGVSGLFHIFKNLWEIIFSEENTGFCCFSHRADRAIIDGYLI